MMTDIQDWLDQVSARLEAVKRLPVQEDREHETAFRAWSDLYEHAPTDLTNALASLRAVLDLHKRIPSRLWWRTSPGSEEPPPVRPSDICGYCRGNYPCPTVLTIQDAIGEDQS